MLQFLRWFRFRAAILLTKSGRTRLALGQFQSLLRLDPDNFQCRQWAARCLDRLDRQDEAIAEYQGLIARVPENGWAYRSLGFLFQRLGRHAEAIPLYEAAAELPRADGWNSYNLGVCHEILGNWQRAAMAYRRASSLDPKHLDAFIRLGDMLDRLGHWADAERVFRRAMDLSSGSLSARLRLARALVNLNRPHEALPLIEKVAADGIEDSWELAELSSLLLTLGQKTAAQDVARLTVARLSDQVTRNPEDADAFSNLGLAHGHLDALEDAVHCHREAMRLRPDAGRALDLGEALTRLERHDEAIGAFREALTIDPSSPETRHRLGLALLEAKRTVEAISLFRATTQEHPGFAAGFASLAAALGIDGLLAAALREAARAVEVDPQSGYARASFGWALLGLFRPVDALEQLEQACRLDRGGPNEVFALRGYGHALSGLNRFTEAENALRKALELAPGFIDTRLQLVQVLSEQDRHDEALSLMRQICDEQPEDAEVQSSLSLTLQFAGNHEEGLAAAKRAVALDRNSANAQSALGWARLRTADPGGALECFDRSHELLPEYLAFLAGRAAALSALGRHVEAVATFDAVSVAAPDFFKYYGENYNEYVERSRAAVRTDPD